MTNDWLLLADAFGVPFSRVGMNARIVELTATYLVQSTLFLVVAWAFVEIRFRFTGRLRPPSPSSTEAVWKLAAILPLLTVPLCVGVGWSHPVMKWSLASYDGVDVAANDRDGKDVKDERDVFPAESPMTSLQAIKPVDFVTTENIDLDAVAGNASSVDSTRPLPRTNGPAEPVSFADSYSLSSPSFDNDVVLATATSATAGRDMAQDISVDSSTKVGVVQNWQSPMTSISWCGVAIMAWFAACLTRLAWKGISLGRWLRRCDLIDGDLRRSLDQLIPPHHTIRLRRASGSSLLKKVSATLQAPRKPQNIDVPESSRHLFQQAGNRPGTGQPFACGVWSWTIVLPLGIEDRLSPVELRALLAHEVAHLVRRDAWWQWLGEFLCTCFAFQPLNFLARRRWQQAAELLCDDWAVDHDVLPTSLASCLAQIAEWRLERRALSRNFAGIGLPAIGPSGSLTRRIEWLLRSERPKVSIRPIAQRAAALTTFAAGLLVGIYGPRLVLTSPVEAAAVSKSNQDDDAIWQTIDFELTAALQDLERLQSSLKTISDPETAALAEDLIKRTRTLKKELDQ